MVTFGFLVRWRERKRTRGNEEGRGEGWGTERVTRGSDRFALGVLEEREEEEREEKRKRENEGGREGKWGRREEYGREGVTRSSDRFALGALGKREEEEKVRAGGIREVEQVEGGRRRVWKGKAGRELLFLVTQTGI